MIIILNYDELYISLFIFKNNSEAKAITYLRTKQGHEQRSHERAAWSIKKKQLVHSGPTEKNFTHLMSPV